MGSIPKPRTNANNVNVFSHVKAYLGAGLQVLPIRADGSEYKVPPEKYLWSHLQDPAQHAPLTDFKGRGIAVIHGKASGGSEVIDADGPACYAPWCELVEAECPGLVQRLVMIQTPRMDDDGQRGVHIVYRCDVVGGAQKLAYDAQGKLLFETKGEGGYTLVPGCPPACHETGRTYEMLAGDLLDLPRITPEEREVLLRCARSFDERPVEQAKGESTPSGNGSTGQRPGDLLNAGMSWDAILEPHGWTKVGAHYWRRPGKARGWSASTARKSKQGNEVLHVFSGDESVSPLEPDGCYNKFAAFVTLNHGGDYTEGTKAAVALGFQTPVLDGLGGILGQGDQAGDQADPFANFPAILSGTALIATYPERRPIVVDGLIRGGDVCNVVAAPKVGKSWLAMNLAMSVAAGETWLGQFETAPGRTLYVDNELHPTDAAFRLREVSRALETPAEVLADRYHVVSFRGFPVELSIVCRWIRHMVKDREPGYYKLIVIDTLSKMLAGDKSENENSYMRSVYTQLEALAADLNSAIAIVHHTSRGDQSEKSVTDTGAGAGSQSRACDCHIAVRPHVEDGFCVLDAVVRSFPGSPSLSIRWDYPLWSADGGKAPELGNTQTKRKRQKLDRAMREALEIINAHPETPYTVSKLDDLIEGLGYGTVREACEKLADELEITRQTGSYKGKNTVVYGARI